MGVEPHCDIIRPSNTNKRNRNLLISFIYRSSTSQVQAIFLFIGLRTILRVPQSGFFPIRRHAKPALLFPLYRRSRNRCEPSLQDREYVVRCARCRRSDVCFSEDQGPCSSMDHDVPRGAVARGLQENRSDTYSERLTDPCPLQEALRDYSNCNRPHAAE